MEVEVTNQYGETVNVEITEEWQNKAKTDIILSNIIGVDFNKIKDGYKDKFFDLMLKFFVEIEIFELFEISNDEIIENLYDCIHEVANDDPNIDGKYIL